MKHIAFEGIDGAGKSTQVELQSSYLQNKQVLTSIYRYSEKNNFWGKIIRKGYSLGQQGSWHFIFKPRIVQETLYALSARTNLKSCGRNNSEVLLSDRSIVTAYASHMNDVPERFISLIEPQVTPDLVIYLDVPPEIGLRRIDNRFEKFKDEDLKSLIKFRESYKNIIFKKKPKRLKDTEFVMIDAIKSLEEVTSEVTEVIERFIR